MKPSKSEFRELAFNSQGEVVAIRNYKKFIRHLVARGRYSEARKVTEIMHEEEVHLRELGVIKKDWRGMK